MCFVLSVRLLSLVELKFIAATLTPVSGKIVCVVLIPKLALF